MWYGRGVPAAARGTLLYVGDKRSDVCVHEKLENRTMSPMKTTNDGIALIQNFCFCIKAIRPMMDEISAVSNGHMSVGQLIMGNVEDKNLKYNIVEWWMDSTPFCCLE